MRTLRWLVLVGMVGTSLLVPGEVSAQGRAVPRPGTHVVYGRPYYRPYYPYRPYYRPYYYAPYYRPYYSAPYYPYYAPFYGFGIGFSVGWGWGGWYPGAYYAPYPYGYPYGGYYYDYTSSARLQVTQRNAEVFIDGYLVGVVDDFDGWLQRLRVEPGEHTLEVFLPGHRNYRQNLLFRPGATINIEHVMQPSAPGEPADPRPTPTPRSRPVNQRYPERSPDRIPPPQREPLPPPANVESRDYGSLAIRVQPMDAQVLVDGESWQSPEAGSITLQLTEGAHRVEVRKGGFRSYSAEVRVKRGETISVNVSLSRQ